MSTMKDDEEYWNSNERNFFCFENNEKENILGLLKNDTALLRAGISNINISDSLLGLEESQQGLLKPLSAIVPQRTLNCIFAVDSAYRAIKQTDVEKPDVTVKKILLGQPYSLEQYKSLANKTALLDAVIASGDGNATLGVILFLTKTLKKHLVQSLLVKRPEANEIYIHYLTTRMQSTEIVDLLIMQGRTLDAAMKNLLIIINNTSNVEKLKQKLHDCYKKHFVNLPDCRETAYLQSYIQLLEWQIAVKDKDFTEQFVLNAPLLESLRHVCRDYWNSPEGNLVSPTMLLQQYQISSRQYQNIAVSIRASVQEWEDIDNLLHTKAWFGTKKFQTNLLVEDILKILHKNNAPLDILEKYLNYVDDTKRRLEIAMSFKCHKSVIDILGNQGDKLALQEYKEQIENDEMFVIYAENVLKSLTIKWKT